MAAPTCPADGATLKLRRGKENRGLCPTCGLTYDLTGDQVAAEPPDGS
jgi:hypothetical protein